MDKPFDIERQEKFRDILIELAQSESILNTEEDYKKYYRNFQKIYYSKASTHYRHYYSDIFRILVEIQKDTSLSKGNISILSENISKLSLRYDSIMTGCDKNIGDSLLKLYDHVSLEVARIQYSDSGDDKLSNESRLIDMASRLDNSLDKSKELAKETNDLRDETRAIKETLSKAQTDYIAILGIFASVVLAFVGGMTFSTSVLNNIKEVSIYRLLIVALAIGIVFVTVIFFMFYFIGILTRHNQFTLKTCIPLGIVYLIFGILIGIVLYMWNCGAVESRDDKIKKQFESIEVTESEIVETSDTPDVTEQIDFETTNAAIE